MFNSETLSPLDPGISSLLSLPPSPPSPSPPSPHVVSEHLWLPTDLQHSQWVPAAWLHGVCWYKPQCWWPHLSGLLRDWSGTVMGGCGLLRIKKHGKTYGRTVCDLQGHMALFSWIKTIQLLYIRYYYHCTHVSELTTCCPWKIYGQKPDQGVVLTLYFIVMVSFLSKILDSNSGQQLSGDWYIRSWGPRMPIWFLQCNIDSLVHNWCCWLLSQHVLWPSGGSWHLECGLRETKWTRLNPRHGPLQLHGWKWDHNLHVSGISQWRAQCLHKNHCSYMSMAYLEGQWKHLQFWQNLDCVYVSLMAAV